MKASILLIAVSASAALAQPTSLIKRDGVCQDVLYSVAQCCSPNVLNVAQLDCKTRKKARRSALYSALSHQHIYHLTLADL